MLVRVKRLGVGTSVLDEDNRKDYMENDALLLDGKLLGCALLLDGE